ncbi:MAG: hypothetical protein IKA13_05675 [Bacteroidales bacterium]|nr:hypothetical protein [Bacteroidales bacterium]
MKNIFKFFGTILTIVLTAALTGCTLEEQFESAEAGLHIKVFFPTKVVAGQPMTINGSGFADATKVVFPGEIEVTDFEIVSNDMIRVNAPAGIAAEGGKIRVCTEAEETESPLPLTLGNTVISGYSANAGDQIDGGAQITIYGKDLEFITGVELLDTDGNPDLIEDELFNRKSTGNIIFTVPKKVYEGTFAGKVYTIDGKTFEMPELTYKPASDGGYFETVEHIIWENPDPEGIGSVSWSGQYRFGLEGKDGNNECIATFPAETWDIIKNGTFILKFAPAADAYQIRATTGWWSFDGDGAYDIHGGDERIVDNGDGTFSLTYTISEEPLKSGIYDLIDDQHLLFTGSGYTPLALYYTEEVWVPGGGAVEIVRTSIWKNDGSVGAAAWSGSPYRFAPETNSTGEEIYAVPTDVWEKMKTTPFKVDIQPAADWFQIRILDGWWSVGNVDTNDITPSYEGLVDNGDGTFTFVLDLPSKPDLVPVLDEKHLLFAGDGFTILEMYWEEEIIVEGGGQPSETVVWENDGSFDFVSWGGHFRFGLEGMDSLGECAATFPQDVWDRLKSGPFNLLVTIKPDATWWQIRVMDGWWSVGNDSSGASDITVNTEGVVDNGDGTFTIPIDISGNADLLAVLDAQHLLFSGDAFRIDKIYY